MTAGVNEYIFRVPYSEMMYGSQTIYVKASSEAEAMKIIREVDWENFEEGDYDYEDSDCIQHDWASATLKDVYCTECKSMLPWNEETCECADGWNDPDLTTPDELYGKAS